VSKAAASVAPLAKCILLYASACTTVPPSCARTNKQLHIAYLASWNNSIFGYQLRTIEAENP